MTKRRRIAIIGGGITGLAAAHRLATLSPETEVALFEASERVGGILQTVRQGGYLIEQSADSFVTNVPWGLELCRELGIDDDLIPTEPSRRKAMVVRDGKLVPVPAGFQLLTPAPAATLMKSPLLSEHGKMRVLTERFIAPRTSREGVPLGSADDDESLESFAVRRLGRECYDRIVQPLVGGIFTADPAKLSMRAALPRFLDLEAKYGSLIAASRQAKQDDGETSPAGGALSSSSTTSVDTQSAGARYGLFVAPREGMQSIVDAIAAKLPEGGIRLSSPIERLEHSQGAWRVTVRGDAKPESFDGVIFAVRAPVAAKLLAGFDDELAQGLAKISYAGSTIALSAYRLDKVADPLDCFGFVVPDVERRDILAASFSSRKYPGRAPDGHVLIRTFLGGALRPDMLALADDDVRAIVGRELGALIGAQGEPELFEIRRWYGAMPQYHLGHAALVANLETRAARYDGLALAGNALRGVGVPQCIRTGREAAERLLL
jgi:oxygen-dependent protoporphyrinogen oxidase